MSSRVTFEKNCEHCQQVFSAKTLFTRFCSKKCNSVFYKQKKRDQRMTEHQTARAKDPPEFEDETYLEVSEAARYMRISKRTLYRLLASRYIRKKKIGSRTVIQKKDIKAFFKQQ